MRFLKIAVDGLSCDSNWVKQTIHKFLCGKCQHVGITDPNHNIKNNLYQNLGGSFQAVMGVYLFDPVLLHLACLSHKLWCPEDFSSDILVLKLLSYKTIKKLGYLGDGDGGDAVVVCHLVIYEAVFLCSEFQRGALGLKNKLLLGLPDLVHQIL